MIVDKVDSSISKGILESIDHNYFPWYYIDRCVDDNDKSFCALTHWVYFHNEIKDYDNYAKTIKLINHIANKHNITNYKIHRIQFNLLVNIDKTSYKEEDTLHKDMFESGYKTILFYLDDSDGNTFVNNYSKNEIYSVKPEKDKYIIFDSDMMHRATPPELHKKRYVINIILKETKL